MIWIASHFHGVIDTMELGVEFDAPHDTVQVISEVVSTANHLTDTDRQVSEQGWMDGAVFYVPANTV